MLIQETIDPESWFDLSDTGEGTILIYDNRKLVVHQTRENHQKIEKLLQAIKGLVQSAYNVWVPLIEPRWLCNINLLIQFTIQEGGFNIHLVNFHVLCCSSCQQSHP